MTHSTGNNTEAVLNFVTKLDSDFLIKGYRSLMHSLYENAYYQRIKSYLSRYRHVGRREYLGVAGLKAILEVPLVSGVRYPGRWPTARFLLQHPGALPREDGQAVALAIYAVTISGWSLPICKPPRPPEQAYDRSGTCQ